MMRFADVENEKQLKSMRVYVDGRPLKPNIRTRKPYDVVTAWIRDLYPHAKQIIVREF